ncbi:MAG: SIS domain-containing protein, partial [Clostridia bacterium]|nr:SIS domain-containing protein [Clostridia bacterium]
MNSTEYLKLISSLVDRLDPSALDSAADLILQAMDNKKTIFVAGNGGSAATANHFAADFGKNVVIGDENRPKVMSLNCNMS